MNDLKIKSLIRNTNLNKCTIKGIQFKLELLKFNLELLVSKCNVLFFKLL